MAGNNQDDDKDYKGVGTLENALTNADALGTNALLFAERVGAGGMKANLAALGLAAVGGAYGAWQGRRGTKQHERLVEERDKLKEQLKEAQTQLAAIKSVTDGTKSSFVERETKRREDGAGQVKEL